MNNYYTLFRGDVEVGTIWKIGKFWIALAEGQNLGGSKSLRHAKAKVLRALAKN